MEIIYSILIDIANSLINLNIFCQYTYRRLTETLKDEDFWVRNSILYVMAKKRRKTSTTITINKRDLASWAKSSLNSFLHIFSSLKAIDTTTQTFAFAEHDYNYSWSNAKVLILTYGERHTCVTHTHLLISSIRHYTMAVNVYLL